MQPVFKFAASIVVFIIALIIVERWYNIFYQGRLFDSLGFGMAVAGFLVPIVVIGGGIYLIVKIVRA